MVKDRFNEYYTELYKALKVDWPTLEKSTKLTDVPAKYPSMYVRQIGGSAKVDTLSGTNEIRDIAIEVQFVAKKQSEVRKLADAATEFMTETLFFMLRDSHPEENIDSKDTYRYICRFSKLYA